MDIVKKENIVTITPPQKSLFRIVWVIDVVAKSAKSAALDAEKAMADLGFRPYFSVINSDGDVTNIDLESGKR
jgi:hypothetical protein